MTHVTTVTPGYEAATKAVALVDRSDLRFWRFTGRDPSRMLTGVMSGRMPERPRSLGEGEGAGAGTPGAASVGVDAATTPIDVGEATLHTVLTPKGRMVADLLLARETAADGGPDALWAVVPSAAADGLREHLKRYLPPRFAKLEEPDGVSFLGVVGPEAAAILSRVVLGLAVETSTLEALPARGTLVVRDGASEPLRLVRSGETTIPAWHVIGSDEEVASVRRALETAGVVPATFDDWTVLRVEAGTPAYGADMDEGTMPPEAGLEEAAIDHAKGCYTGQEVIVRIRDRGHVNRKLRRVPLGDLEPPPNGTELFVEGREKPAAVLRSAVRSPRFGQTIGLAYVRRDVWTGEGDPPEFLLRD